MSILDSQSFGLGLHDFAMVGSALHFVRIPAWNSVLIFSPLSLLDRDAAWGPLCAEQRQ